MSRIDSWVRPKNNGKNQGDQISKNQMSNNEIKKIKDKKIAIKSIRTSFEKKRDDCYNKFWVSPRITIFLLKWKAKKNENEIFFGNLSRAD